MTYHKEALWSTGRFLNFIEDHPIYTGLMQPKYTPKIKLNLKCEDGDTWNEVIYHFLPNQYVFKNILKLVLKVIDEKFVHATCTDGCITLKFYMTYCDWKERW